MPAPHMHALAQRRCDQLEVSAAGWRLDFQYAASFGEQGKAGYKRLNFGT